LAKKVWHEKQQQTNSKPNLINGLFFYLEIRHPEIQGDGKGQF